jgi:hypothetical protein
MENFFTFDLPSWASSGKKLQQFGRYFECGGKIKGPVLAQSRPIETRLRRLLIRLKQTYCSNPPAYRSAVTHPLVAKSLLQLPLLASNKEINERKMKRGDHERGRRSEH